LTSSTSGLVSFTALVSAGGGSLASVTDAGPFATSVFSGSVAGGN